MRYTDGQEVRLGDKVRLWEGCTGVVVFSIDSDQYSANYPKESWSYLSAGVMFETGDQGLIHCTEADEDMVLIERAAS